MGNSKSEEQFDPSFNFQQYNRKMDAIRNQYGHHNQLDGMNLGPPPKKTTHIETEQIHRAAYLYKPSVQININHEGTLMMQFQYDAKKQSKLEISVGVKTIKENQQTKKTQSIESSFAFSDWLGIGDKQKYNKKFDVSQSDKEKLFSEGIMIRIISQDEISEYSFAFLKKSKEWKTVVEKFEKGQKVYGIEDIFGGDGENQECIICMSDVAVIMVKPCNHVCFCQECGKDLVKKTENCPICRKRIASLVMLKK